MQSLKHVKALYTNIKNQLHNQIQRENTHKNLTTSRFISKITTNRNLKI